jgi:hypothetical protein
VEAKEETTDISFTNQEAEQIKDLAKQFPDLNTITRKFFANEKLDGRSKQGIAIRSFLASNKINYKTSKYEKAADIQFTDSQKEFIIDQTAIGLSAVRIAELLFPDRRIVNLGVEQRAVANFVRTANVEGQLESETAIGVKYLVPRSVERVVNKINQATGEKIDKEKLSRQHKMCIEKLTIHLANSRFQKIINCYTSQEDRDIFEEEFIRMTWDKPDLTADEVNLYMNVCKEIINLETTSRHLDKLNKMFEDTQEQNEMSIRLAEIIKAKSGEYHQCEGRVESLIKKLQGDRSGRINAKQKENASILAIVQLFQDEEERANMIKIAEMQKTLVREEAGKLESMVEWKARILGISLDDAV